ncbi:extensin [Cryptococcus gattii NT-10]|nr:extensin [Cryptococcus gattii NT-10]
MPLPVERSQGSVSALVARFQTAANKEKEASEREKEKDRGRVSLGEGRRVSDVVAAKEAVGNVDSSSQPTASASAKTVPIDSSDEKDTIKENAPQAQTHPRPPHASPTATSQSRIDTARVSPSTPSTTPAKSAVISSTKSSLGRASSIKTPARSTPAQIQGQSKANKPRTHSTQNSAKQTSVLPSPSSITSPSSTLAKDNNSTSTPLKPQLTGTPSKPTASSLAKTRSSPSSNPPSNMRMRSPPVVDDPTAGRAERRSSSSFGRQDGIKSPLSSPGSLTGKSSLGRAASARLSQTKSPLATSTISRQRRVSENGSGSPQPQEEKKESKSVTESIGGAAGSRLMQGTAASRARAAANTNPHSSLISSNSHNPISSTSPSTSAKITRPRASISTPVSNSKKPVSNGNNDSNAKGPTLKSNPKDLPALRPNVSSVAKDEEGNPGVKSVGKNPMGRLGLAAAREKKDGNEDDKTEALHPPPIGRLGLAAAREDPRKVSGKQERGNIVEPSEQQTHHLGAEDEHEQGVECEVGIGEKEKQKGDGTLSEPTGEAGEALEGKDRQIDVEVGAGAGRSSSFTIDMKPQGVETRLDELEDGEETKCAGEPTEPLESPIENNVQQNNETNDVNEINETNETNDREDSEEEKEEGKNLEEIPDV